MAEQSLSDNRRFSVADAKALARAAQSDPGRLRQLMASVTGDDPVAARRAAWALTHVPADDGGYLEPYRDTLVATALATADTTLRRLTLTLLERMEWGRADVRTDLLDFCLAGITDIRQPYGVRALCVKLAGSLCRHYPELVGELCQTLGLMPYVDLGPGLRAAVKNTLRRLDQDGARP